MEKADINTIMVVKPEKELDYTEDNKFNSETSDNISLPYNDDNLNKIMNQYYDINDSKSPVEVVDAEVVPFTAIGNHGELIKNDNDILTEKNSLYCFM